MDFKELEPVIQLITEQEERLVKKLDAIIARQDISNGRISKVEERQSVQDNKCIFIQDGKARAIVRNRWIITTLLVIIGLLTGTFYKDKNDRMIPLEVIYKQTDSTYLIPRMYMRSKGEQSYREVHELYVDVENTQKK